MKPGKRLAHDFAVDEHLASAFHDPCARSRCLASSNAQRQPRPDKPVFVTVKPDMTLGIGEDVVPRDGLGAALGNATKNNKDERIFVRADKAVSYGDLMEVMNLLRDAGYLKIALVGLDGRSAP